jgi:hypothetical protein
VYHNVHSFINAVRLARIHMTDRRCARRSSNASWDEQALGMNAL